MTGIFNGQNGAPRQVAVIPLSVDIDVAAAIRVLNESVDVSNASVSGDSLSRVRVDRFRQSVQYIPAKYDLVNALDVSRMGDFVVLILSAEIEAEEQGELMLRAIEGQGISNVMAVVQVRVHSHEIWSRMNSFLNDCWIGSRESQPRQETPAGYGFPEVVYEPLFSFCREGPFSRLETGMLQRCSVSLYSNAQGNPLARRPKLDAHRKYQVA